MSISFEGYWYRLSDGKKFDVDEHMRYILREVSKSGFILEDEKSAVFKVIKKHLKDEYKDKIKTTEDLHKVYAKLEGSKKEPERELIGVGKERDNFLTEIMEKFQIARARGHGKQFTFEFASGGHKDSEKKAYDIINKLKPKIQNMNRAIVFDLTTKRGGDILEEVNGKIDFELFWESVILELHREDLYKKVRDGIWFTSEEIQNKLFKRG